MKKLILVLFISLFSFQSVQANSCPMMTQGEATTLQTTGVSNEGAIVLFILMLGCAFSSDDEKKEVVDDSSRSEKDVQVTETKESATRTPAVTK